MKKIISMTICLCVLAFAGSALAIPLTSEYELISPTPIVGTPVYQPGSDLGYFIWTDDLARTSWHMRWSGAGPDTLFTGNLILEGAVFDDFAEFSFEGVDNFTSLNNEYVNYLAIANVWEDGFDFTLSQLAAPSFVGFDLFMDGSQAIGDNIFFGANAITASSLGSDGDFKIAAPVPEPATLFLLGSGLVGLAFLKRRKS